MISVGRVLALVCLMACDVISRPSVTPADTTCPVTLPSESPVDLTYAPLPRDRFAWYGNSSLAVMLPKDGAYRAAPGSEPLEAKIAWHRFVGGRIQIVAENVDGPAAPIRTEASEGYGVIGFNASGLSFTREGCWRVEGTVDGRGLTFVMRVRRAQPGEPAP
jgi:hypothetical protein